MVRSWSSWWPTQVPTGKPLAMSLRMCPLVGNTSTFLVFPPMVTGNMSSAPSSSSWVFLSPDENFLGGATKTSVSCSRHLLFPSFSTFCAASRSILIFSYKGSSSIATEKAKPSESAIVTLVSKCQSIEDWPNGSIRLPTRTRLIFGRSSTRITSKILLLLLMAMTYSSSSRNVWPKQFHGLLQVAHDQRTSPCWLRTEDGTTL